MHEMSILSNVVDIVLQHAEENHAVKVVEVSLVVGDMRDVVDELMESCFRFLCRGTVAEQARLTMTKIPVRVQCADCHLVFPVSKGDWRRIRCPDCGGAHFTVRTGREFFIDSITVE